MNPDVLEWVKQKLISNLESPGNAINYKTAASEVITLNSSVHRNGESFHLSVETVVHKCWNDGEIEIVYFTIERVHVFKSDGKNPGFQIHPRELDESIEY